MGTLRKDELKRHVRAWIYRYNRACSVQCYVNNSNHIGKQFYCNGFVEFLAAACTIEAVIQYDSLIYIYIYIYIYISSSSLCAICSQQVGCHGSPSFSILCHSDTVIIWHFGPFLDVIRPHCSRSPSSSSTIYPSLPSAIVVSHLLLLYVQNIDTSFFWQYLIMIFWFSSCVKRLH